METYPTGIISIHDPLYTTSTISFDNDKTLEIETFHYIGKVFHGDIVRIENNKCILSHSNIKTKTIIGVLELYSKYKFKSNKRGIERFKCIPIEKHYPAFLVTSTAKRSYNKNILVQIKYLSWDDTLPYGQIVHILGQVDDMNALYDGVLYRYSLHKKTYRFTKQELENIQKESLLNTTGYRDITDNHTISIDPEGTLDIDDAFSYSFTKDHHCKLGIHISDVIGTLHDYGLSHLLQDSLSTSIYAPHKTVHMFPPTLSNQLISLLPNKRRKAITLWLDIYDNEIISTTIEKTVIINKKTYSYDEFTKRSEKFKRITKIIKHLHYKNITDRFKVDFDSHRLIEKLMIIYNCEACRFIQSNGYNPIYRTHENKMGSHTENVDSVLGRFLKIINSKSAIYTLDNIDTNHHSLQLDNYIHFTSPIRRYVDCYNHSLIHGVLSGVDKYSISINLENINHINKLVKKTDRIFSKLRISEYIQETGHTLFKGYIYDIVDGKVSIYIPSHKLSIVKRLVDKKMNTIYSVETDVENTIKIINKQTCTTEKILHMNILIDIHIYNIVGKHPYKNTIISLY